MKRPGRRSAARGARDHQDPSGGPLHRRRTLRHLHSLAQEMVREPSPTAATAHVRVLGDEGLPVSGPDPAPTVAPNRRLRTEDVPTPVPTPEPTAGDPPPRVRAVPIDQPFGASS